MKRKKLVFEISAIILISFISGLFFNLISGNNISFIYQPLQIESGENISVEQAYELFKEKRALFLDARSFIEFKKGHIEGALSLPAKSRQNNVEKVLKDIPKDRKLVTYCSGSS